MSHKASKNWHACAAANCPRRCQTKYLMCWIHWNQVPRNLQARIYQTFREGMGPDYDAAVSEAIEIIAKKEAAKAGLVA